MWLCLKKCIENRVLGVLLQIGAKHLTVTKRMDIKDFLEIVILRYDH